MMMDTAPAPSPKQGTPLALGQASSLKRVYLERLRRLQQLHHRHERELNHQGLRLINRSIFEAYCMCREIGAEQEARAILQGETPDEPPRAPLPGAA